VFQPKPVADPVATGPCRFEYLRAYNYIFENPNWINTVLMWSLCALVAGFIPILPYLLIIGHMFEMVESLYLTRGTRYPDFDFNRFSEYLGRGIWPLLVGFIAMLPLLVIIYGGMFGVIFAAAGAAAAGGDELGPVLAVIVGLFGFVLLMALAIGVGLLLTPMALRAGLQQDFAAAFDFGWAMDFVKKTWVEMILSMLFMNLTGVLLELIGLLALCIGIYPAMAIMMMGQTYMLYQLYALYLSRGGTPIPLKPQYPVAPQGYMPPPGGYPPPPQQF
jgi:hypothetical protein